MVVDFHTHNFPAALAPRAVELMLGKLNGLIVPAGDGTIDTELRDMDRAGVDCCVNCPVATKPGQFDAIFRRALAVRSGKEGESAARRIFQLGSVHPDDPDFAKHIRTLKENGIPGIKLHPQYQGVRIADPKYVPFFTALRDAGLFVISHCGFDPGFSDWPIISGPEQIAAILTVVPGLKFVAAHLGGHCGSPPRAIDRLLSFENCWIDTAVMCICDDDPEAHRIVREWPAHRMVFGTDYFWRDEAKLMAWVKVLRPDPAAQKLIFSENAQRLLGIAGHHTVTSDALPVAGNA